MSYLCYQQQIQVGWKYVHSPLKSTYRKWFLVTWNAFGAKKYTNYFGNWEGQLCANYDRTTTSWCGQYWFRRISIYLSFFLYAFFSSRFSQNCQMDIIETRTEHLYRMPPFGKGVLSDSEGCPRSLDLEIKNSLPSINSIFSWLGSAYVMAICPSSVVRRPSSVNNSGTFRYPWTWTFEFWCVGVLGQVQLACRKFPRSDQLSGH